MGAPLTPQVNTTLSTVICQESYVPASGHGCHTLGSPEAAVPGAGWIVASTHQSLLAMDISSGAAKTLHRGLGHYYGVIPAESVGLPRGGLLVGSQFIMSAAVRNTSCKLRGDSSFSRATGLPQQLSSLGPARGMPLQEEFSVKDMLVLLSPGTLGHSCPAGEAFGRYSFRSAWEFPTRYLHDTVYDREDGVIHTVDTSNGKVTALRPSLKDEKQLQLRVERSYAASEGAKTPVGAHINNAALGGGYLWVMQNMLRAESAIVIINRASGRVARRVTLGFPNCHQVMFHRGSVLFLLSSEGGIGRLGPSGQTSRLWSAGEDFFSKGLTVIDDVAYFGLSKKKGRFDRNNAVSEIAAFELGSGALRWRRTLPGLGLVNAVSAPYLDASCTFRACSSFAAGGSADARTHAPKVGQWSLAA